MPRGYPGSGPAKQNEQALQAKIVALCKELGLLVFHSTDSRRDIGGGFPDLVIASKLGNSSLIFAELKGPAGSMSPSQQDWRWAIIASGGGMAHRIWKPKDWLNGDIQAELRQIA